MRIWTFVQDPCQKTKNRIYVAKGMVAAYEESALDRNATGSAMSAPSGATLARVTI